MGPESDAGVHTRTLTVEADGCEVPVRLMWSKPPAGTMVVVLHEKRGLDDHTLGVAQRLAAEGYPVMLPDLLSRTGGSQGRSSLASGSRGLPTSWLLEDVRASVDAVLDAFHVDAFGVVGYSFGGELAWRLAGSDPRCRALIDYHGRPPVDPSLELDDVATLVLLGDADDHDKVAPTRQALTSSRASHVEVFEGLHRGFEDPSRPDRFDADAAERAWRLTVGWLKGHLG